MVRRALSLRRGSTLGLEIETESTTSTKPMSFGAEDRMTSQDDGTESLAASHLIRRGSRRDSSTSALPLSRHHQSMRRRSSVAGTTSTIETIMKSRNRHRTDSSSTSVSAISFDSVEGKGTPPLSRLREDVADMDANGNMHGSGMGGRSSSLLDNELAVVLDDDDEGNGNNTSRGP